ncbi:hypothetical protein Aglo01_44020 [Actinokineospora globicatena]|nr:hypothetical protein Aglo01_44020 [Actinokineospora globicatena]
MTTGSTHQATSQNNPDSTEPARYPRIDLVVSHDRRVRPVRRVFLFSTVPPPPRAPRDERPLVRSPTLPGRARWGATQGRWARRRGGPRRT